MKFDYDKLQSRIIEKYKSQMEFFERMQWPERLLLLKLDGTAPWGQMEISRALELLELSGDEIQTYFFDRKVQNI